MADDNFFIVIEGLDGTGKTSISRQLDAILRLTHADDVLLTNEPNYQRLLGSELRSVLAREITCSSILLAQAFALNRTDHIEKVIAPFLEDEQRIVICDRYVLSSLVYQSVDDISMDDVYALNRWARRPDLTLHLHTNPLEAYARLGKRPTNLDLFENNLKERAEKYQAGIALLRDKGETIIEVDANPAFSQVLAAVLAVLKAHGPPWLRIQPPLLLD